MLMVKIRLRVRIRHRRNRNRCDNFKTCPFAISVTKINMAGVSLKRAGTPSLGPVSHEVDGLGAITPSNAGTP